MSNAKAKVKKQSSPLRIDFGCGQNCTVGADGVKFTGVDFVKCPGVDVVHDLTKFPYPFKDNSVDEIVSNHFVEHLTGEDFIKHMDECYRILKMGAKMTLRHPYCFSARAFQDPTHCFSDDTEILTKSGFKLIKDVNVGDQVITLNKETLKAEYANVLDTVFEKYDGDMISFKTDRMDLLVTPNHDMFYSANFDQRKYKPKYKLKRADDFEKLTGHHSRIGNSVINFNVNEYPNTFMGWDIVDFAKFLGWFLAEGYITVSKTAKYVYRIGICQYKNVNYEKYIEIENLLTRMNFKFNKSDKEFTFCHKELYNYLIQFGHCYDKFIPEIFKNLPPSIMNEMLMCMIKGDGRAQKNIGKRRTSGWEYASTSRKLANDVSEVALKCGYRVTQYGEKRNYVGKINGSKDFVAHELFIVGITEPSTIYYPRAKRVKYNGDIACVSVDKNNVIYVRRNGRGIWSGNCTFIPAERYLYFDKNWRVANRLDHYPIKSDYEYQVYVTYHNDKGQVWQNKSNEAVQFAMGHYVNVVADLEVHLKKR